VFRHLFKFSQNKIKFKRKIVMMLHRHPEFRGPRPVSLRKRRQNGFSLIEIMVVMIILGMLIAAVAPQILGRTDQAKVTVAEQDIRTLEQAFDMYKLDNHTYPS